MKKAGYHRLEIYIYDNATVESYKQAAANLGLSVSSFFRQAAEAYIKQTSKAN